MYKFPDTMTPEGLPPGYVWCTKDKELYSYKGGTLCVMKSQSAGYKYWSRITMKSAYYTLSVNGKRRYVFMDDLLKIKAHTYEYIVPQEKIL